MKNFFIFVYFLSFAALSSRYENLSVLEKKSTDNALKTYNLIIDNEPQNKIIKNVFIYVDKPFLDNELFSFTNLFHINTKNYLVLKDVFIKSGEVYNEAKILDSELTLRKSYVRSLALIIPIKNSSREVDLLVVTRDLFSINASLTFKAAGKELSNLDIIVGENNLLGLNQSIHGIYNLDLSNHAVYLRYFIPKILNSNWQLTLKPGMFIGRDKEHKKGAYGSLKLAYPLKSFNDKWGFDISAEAYKKLIMDIRNNIPTKIMLGNKEIERRYMYQNFFSTLKTTRSIGYLEKKEIYFGHSLSFKKPIIEKELKLTASQIQIFKDKYLVKNELESFLFVGFNYFENNFLSLYDYESFSLQESKRLGLDFDISLDLASKLVLFSDEYFIRPNTTVSYTWQLFNDAFIKTKADFSTRYNKEFLNNNYLTGLEIVSPKVFDTFRIIFASNFKETIKNRDNLAYSLGANSGLRGVTDRFYNGTKSINANLEFRSMPLDLALFQTGLVLFYDAGSAFNEWNKMNPTHSMGVGLRFLVPQFASEVFRVDFGFAIAGKSKQNQVFVPSLGTGQGF